MDTISHLGCDGATPKTSEKTTKKAKPTQTHAPKDQRKCFVTVGATASFLRLLREVLDPAFLDCLAELWFDELTIQTGPDHEWALHQLELLEQQRPERVAEWPIIHVIPYTTDMASVMLPCRGDLTRLPGIMISHAGSGSILDAVRLDIPLIVIPNPDLQGNHQEELADAVHTSGWAIKGELGQISKAVLLLREKIEEQTFVPHQESLFPVVESDRCSLFDWTALHASHRPSVRIGLLNLD